MIDKDKNSENTSLGEESPVNETKETTKASKEFKAKKNKGPIEDSNKSTIIIISVLFILVLGLAAWHFYANGFFEKQATALEANGTKYTPAQVNFYAGLVSQGAIQEGIFSDGAKEQLKSTEFSNNKDKTLREIIMENAYKFLTFDRYSLDNAKADNYVNPPEVEQISETFFTQMKNHAAESGTDLETFLHQHYGKGADVDSVKASIQDHLRARSYESDLQKSYKFTDAEMDAEYEKDKNIIDVADIRRIPVTLDSFMPEPEPEELNTEEKPDEEKSEEEKAAEAKKKEKQEKEKAEAIEKAKARANEIFEAVDGKSEEEFIKIAAEKMPESLMAMLKDLPDPTLIEAAPMQSLGLEIGQWVYSEDRKEGDTKMFEDGNNYTIVRFVKRYKPEMPLFTSRHILINFPGERGAEPTPEEDKETKEKAEKIYEDFKAGEQTEERFAELANDHSQDPGNQQKNGGLYSKIPKGQFVPEYEEYCLDPARKPGDTAIVRSKFGYHIVYFVSLDGPKWKNAVEDILREQKFAAYMKEAENTVKIEEKSGMKYVLPMD